MKTVTQMSGLKMAQGFASRITKILPIRLQNLRHEMLGSEPLRHLVSGTVFPLLVAASAASLVSACAGMALLSDTELQVAVSTNVTRKTLQELDPQISDYYRKLYGDRFANPNLTGVPDILLGSLVAKTNGPAFTVAATWNVPAVMHCRFPSLTKSVLDQLSHGDKYLILLSQRFMNSSLGTQEQLILAHEVFHFVQIEQGQPLPDRDCSQPSTLGQYIELPEEQGAYKAEMRYAQTALEMTWGSYLFNRFGITAILDTSFRETLKSLWGEVAREQGRAANRHFFFARGCAAS